MGNDRLWRKISCGADERVCIFIDNSNLFHALRKLYQRHRRLDYVKLKDVLAGNRVADARLYHTVPSNPSTLNFEMRRKHDKEQKFLNGIQKIGYTLVSIPMRERTSEEEVFKESGLVFEIIYDVAMFSKLGCYKKFILVACDEDYARLVRRIQTEVGLPVEVAYFGGIGCSSVLMREAHRFIDLSEVSSKIFRDYRTTSDVAVI